MFFARGLSESRHLHEAATDWARHGDVISLAGFREWLEEVHGELLESFLLSGAHEYLGQQKFSVTNLLAFFKLGGLTVHQVDSEFEPHPGAVDVYTDHILGAAKVKFIFTYPGEDGSSYNRVPVAVVEGTKSETPIGPAFLVQSATVLPVLYSVAFLPGSDAHQVVLPAGVPRPSLVPSESLLGTIGGILARHVLREEHAIGCSLGGVTSGNVPKGLAASFMGKLAASLNSPGARFIIDGEPHNLWANYESDYWELATASSSSWLPAFLPGDADRTRPHFLPSLRQFHKDFEYHEPDYPNTRQRLIHRFVGHPLQSFFTSQALFVKYPWFRKVTVSILPLQALDIAGGSMRAGWHLILDSGILSGEFNPTHHVFQHLESLLQALSDQDAVAYIDEQNGEWLANFYSACLDLRNGIAAGGSRSDSIWQWVSQCFHGEDRSAVFVLLQHCLGVISSRGAAFDWPDSPGVQRDLVELLNAHQFSTELWVALHNDRYIRHHPVSQPVLAASGGDRSPLPKGFRSVLILPRAPLEPLVTSFDEVGRYWHQVLNLNPGLRCLLADADDPGRWKVLCAETALILQTELCRRGLLGDVTADHDLGVYSAGHYQADIDVVIDRAMAYSPSGGRAHSTAAVVGGVATLLDHWHRGVSPLDSCPYRDWVPNVPSPPVVHRVNFSKPVSYGTRQVDLALSAEEQPHAVRQALSELLRVRSRDLAPEFTVAAAFVGSFVADRSVIPLGAVLAELWRGWTFSSSIQSILEYFEIFVRSAIPVTHSAEPAQPANVISLRSYR